jgi:hypothetical protein
MHVAIKTLAIFVFALILEPAMSAEVANSPPPTTATRPSTTGPEQNSVPNDAAPASRTRTTGQTTQDPTIKQMNETEKSKVERTGK